MVRGTPIFKGSHEQFYSNIWVLLFPRPFDLFVIFSDSSLLLLLLFYVNTKWYEHEMKKKKKFGVGDDGHHSPVIYMHRTKIF